MTATRLFNAHLIDPSQSLDGIGYLDVIDGVVDAIGLGTPPNSGKFDQLIDCKKSCLSPGIVDMRVQPADPGAEHLESLSTLLAAAAGGGVTALACLPDTRPVIDEASAIDSLCLRASRIGGPRLYAYGAATKGLAGHEMAELGLMAEAGAVGFTNSATSINDSLIMRRLLAYSNMLDKPFIQHCEDHALTKDAEMNEGETSTRLGLLGSPSEAEVIIIDRDLHLLRRTGARYHVAHISTRAGIEAVREAKAEGLAVTADTAPPYFLLNELAISTYNTAFKLSPPLRSEDDRQAVIEGLVDGTIDAIASDHMPVDRDAKMQPFGPAQPGASGLDTLLALSLTLVHQGQISMARMIEAMSLAPASILDIPGGTLTPGSSADFILFRPDSSWIVKSANFRSNSRITPFESHPVQGIVDATYVDGTAIFLRD
ncbi:MAG: dihydroorotase [Proteobacteria bacterium]|nr:dihydroorotase [Pseudomonadota bacterium]MDA0960676.1 dihydroorotase [Pseudomonadota bacterium]MDA1151441.1 dihydroorotase [Pseudomonadota bacterium]